MSFRALHVPGQPFVIPNPWDIGSARLLSGLGFPALASTSAGAAFAQGKPDGALNAAELIQAAVNLKLATGVPVNADLEHGGGNRPSDAADAIVKAHAADLDGASIEDLGTDGMIYPFEHACARVKAAVAAKSGSDFMLTARTEIMLSPAPNLQEVLLRISAFAELGADVVYAPGLTDPSQIKAVVTAANGVPVNVLIGRTMPELTLAKLAELGVARISVGSGMARAAYGALLDMARTIQSDGVITYPETTASFPDIETLLSRS